MTIFVDTNVLLDVILHRSDFYPASREVFDIVETSEITAFISAVSMTNIFYVLRKSGHNSADVYSRMNDLTELFTIAPVSETAIAEAMAMRWKDFEDAVQYMTAQGVKAEYIVTRNKADFETSTVPCISPAEFTAFFK